MSAHGFHVHGPHDHEVEHAAHASAHDATHISLAQKIAVTTAILSTVGALFGYMASLTQAQAMQEKTQAGIRKTEASDQWNFYQAKSTKQHLSQFAAELGHGATRTRSLAQSERYQKEKEEIRQKAEAIEHEAQAANERSEAQMHQHHRWAMAMTAVQIAISLAAITLLTRKRWLLLLAYALSACGGALALMALLHF